MHSQCLDEGRPRGHTFESYFAYKSVKRKVRNWNRLRSFQYLNKTNEDIDNACNVESATFWRLFNPKRNVKYSSVYHEMKFNDSELRDSKQFAVAWGIILLHFTQTLNVIHMTMSITIECAT